MSLQHIAIALLDYASGVLQGLADDKCHPEECHYASAKFNQAASRLKVEPLHLDDIKAAAALVAQAKPSIRVLFDAKHPKHQLGWVAVSVESFNAVTDLLDGLETFQKHLSLNEPGIQTMGTRLRRLLPAGWWGSHV